MMNKQDVGEKLIDLVSEGSIDGKRLARAVYNWMDGNELREFVEFMEDEIGY